MMREVSGSIIAEKFRLKWRRRNCDSLAMLPLRCHKQRPDMTKTELQVALAVATQTNKKIAGVFLDTLSSVAYKEIKKSGEFVLPGFGKLVKQKRKARVGFNPKTQQKIKIPAKTVVKFRNKILDPRIWGDPVEI
jgi:DNA-binding protein HU-beta